MICKVISFLHCKTLQLGKYFKLWTHIVKIVGFSSLGFKNKIVMWKLSDFGFIHSTWTVKRYDRTKICDGFDKNCRFWSESMNFSVIWWLSSVVGSARESMLSLVVKSKPKWGLKKSEVSFTYLECYGFEDIGVYLNKKLGKISLNCWS